MAIGVTVVSDQVFIDTHEGHFIGGLLREVRAQEACVKFRGLEKGQVQKRSQEESTKGRFGLLDSFSHFQHQLQDHSPTQRPCLPRASPRGN